MKKTIIAALLSAIASVPCLAAENKGNVGVNFSTESVFGIHGEWSLASMADNAPVSVQVFLKNYSQDLGSNNTWGTTAIGFAGIYDFSAAAKLDRLTRLGDRIHPYAGIGAMSVSYNWKGNGPAPAYYGVGGGLYVTAGVRYTFTRQVDADFNYNNFGDITVGANFKF